MWLLTWVWHCTFLNSTSKYFIVSDLFFCKYYFELTLISTIHAPKFLCHNICVVCNIRLLLGEISDWKLVNGLCVILHFISYFKLCFYCFLVTVMWYVYVPSVLWQKHVKLLFMFAVLSVVVFSLRNSKVTESHPVYFYLCL